jgi:DNA-binding NarL/FixJ family response regulator
MVVVIVTDNGFAAEAIRRSFKNTSGVRVAGYVDGRRACGAAVSEARPDVVIVDEMTWSANAVARIAEVRRGVPAAKIIVLTAQSDATWLGDAVRAGADAAIAKTVQPATLGLLVREIHAGNIHHAFTGRRAAASPDAGHGKLTPRELEILQLVASGASNGLIARQLWVTEQTIKFHLSNVYRKLSVANRTEASHYAHVHGLTDVFSAPAPAPAQPSSVPFAA